MRLDTYRIAIGVDNKTYKFDEVYKLAHGYIDLTLRSRIEFILDYKKMKADGHIEYYPKTRELLKRMDEITANN